MAERAGPRERAKEVQAEVGRRLARLQAGFIAGDATARATLAQLRRAVTMAPGEAPEIAELTVGGIEPEGAWPPDGATEAERAVHLSFCLYATHQRGKPSTGMHQAGSTGGDGKPARRGTGLGAALATLRSKDKTVQSPIDRRFTALVTAQTWDELAGHLRGVIGQLGDVKLDYARLAHDLVLVQTAATESGVHLQWARDFYRVQRDDADQTSDTPDDIESDE